MSRINELRKQHPNYALDVMEMLRLSIPEQSTKYLELLIKLTKDEKTESDDDDYREYKLNSLKNDYDIDKDAVESLSTSMIAIMENSLGRLISSPNHRTFRKFCELNERGLINNNDVSTYSTFDQIEQAVSMAELKVLDKELAKQIKIIFEDDEWIVLRPLSLEASQKYGAATKWCTTTSPNSDEVVSESDLSSYFDKYSYRGILIYTINKKTGHKIGTFKNLDPDREREFSFWNAKDERIDSLDSGLPTEILGKIKNEIYNFFITNYAIAGKDDYTKRVKIKKKRTAEEPIPIPQEPNPTPQGETMDALRRMIWAASEGIENDEQAR